MAVVVETTIGDFTVDLYTEERPQSKCKTKIEVMFSCYYVLEFSIKKIWLLMTVLLLIYSILQHVEIF